MYTLQSIAYTMYFGFPLVGYLGILSYVLLLITASLMVLTKKRILRVPVKYHRQAALITILIATIHFLLAISIYL